MFTEHFSRKCACLQWLPQCRMAELFALSLLMMLTALPVVHAVPMINSYQGTLPITYNTTVNLTFSLYNVPGAGKPLWTETHPNVAVKAGSFSVYLGSKVALPPDAIQGERYLGVIVNNQKELLPRQALVSGFFAMRAGVAESVAVGSITADKLGAASITTEKVAAGAVTGDKLAASVITTDKIANGAVTKEKLSADVQQKLAQVGTGSLPAAVATLNVTEKLKIGKNSLYLGPTIPTATDNSIYSDGSDLLLQSSSNVFNTVINANNTGKVGIGTNDPKAKLEVAGMVRVSTHTITSSDLTEGLLFNYETGVGKGTDIISTRGGLDFNKLALNGSVITLNATSRGNVGIGTDTPKAKLDVEGEIQGKLWYSQEFLWSQSFPAVKMSPANDGFCFLTAVQGKFVGYGDVSVYIKDGFWYLGGNSGQAHVVGKARCSGKSFTPELPSDSWITRIQSGSPFKMILDDTKFADPDNNWSPMGTIKAGNTYTCTYGGAAFTCSGYNQGARRDGSWTYGGVNPTSKEISLWGRKFTFDDAGEIYDYQYGHVGYLSK